jgi:hypothetical protein
VLSILLRLYNSGQFYLWRWIKFLKYFIILKWYIYRLKNPGYQAAAYDEEYLQYIYVIIPCSVIKYTNCLTFGKNCCQEGKHWILPIFWLLKNIIFGSESIKCHQLLDHDNNVGTMVVPIYFLPIHTSQHSVITQCTL